MKHMPLRCLGGIGAAFFIGGRWIMFARQYEEWMQKQIAEEKNHRRRELPEKGLSHGTVEFLRCIRHPVVGSFEHLYAEREARDFQQGYRYPDPAFMPGGRTFAGNRAIRAQNFCGGSSIRITWSLRAAISGTGHIG
jgi:hypothetical protein